MKWWMLPWLLPVGMLGAVVFVSVFNGYSALLVLPLAAVLLPIIFRLHFPADRDDPDADVNYWRLGRR